MIKTKRYSINEIFKFLTFSKISALVLLIWIHHNYNNGNHRSYLLYEKDNTSEKFYLYCNRLLEKYEYGNNSRKRQLSENVKGSKNIVNSSQKWTCSSNSDYHPTSDTETESEQLNICTDSEDDEPEDKYDGFCAKVLTSSQKRALKKFCCSQDFACHRHICRRRWLNKLSKKPSLYFVYIPIVLTILICFLAAGLASSSMLYPVPIILIKAFSLFVIFILIKMS
ncbi:Plasmodium exported protein, unknown function [Plasmodium gonderi]|uniref:Uncharacterized protein n=1 Tax=Plasmodium gonderi TaxID=77519 RepID=A0A1Y1J943_PLAGO|nr:Plasmodium exported protein, unknown function [Plasmodium gonderi]GAW79026.1 Plasmodium exported protein, unknown function [Plasmodium gonderi]